MSDKVREEEQSLMEYPIMRIATPLRRQRQIWITLTVVNTIMFLTSVVILASKWQSQTGKMKQLLNETSFYSELKNTHRVGMGHHTDRIQAQSSIR